MNIYALKDTNTGRFYPPFYADSHNGAFAQIKENLLSPAGVQLVRLKDSLDIYFLGSIDFNTGIIMPCLRSCDSSQSDYDYNSYEPKLVFTLSDVVSQIPEKVLSPELTHEDLKRVYAEIKELSTQLSQLGEAYNSHKHTKKGAYLIDDQKKF